MALTLFFLLMQAALAAAPQVPSLHAAIAKRDLSAAEALMNAGADLNLRDAQGRTPLHVAAVAEGPGKLELIHRLIAAGADPNARDNAGASPLDDAAWKGYTEKAALLLDGGANINEPESTTGATPLNEAVFMGHIDVVKLLLARGAAAGIRDRAGFLPIENAIREHHPDLVALLAHGESLDLLNHLLEESIRRSQAGSAAILMDAGALPDARFASGSTPLYDASLRGDNEMVCLLVGRGANVNQREVPSLTTPLYAAAAFGRQQVVATLLLWGADPNLVGKEGVTPLEAAKLNRFPKIAEQIRVASRH